MNCMIAAFVVAATQLQPMVPLQTLDKVKSVTGRATCVSRGFEVIGGVTNVVEVWRRGNLQWAVTNVARRVIGKRQTNTFRDRLDALKASVDEWKERADDFEAKYQVRAKIIAAQVAILLKKREAYVKLRDASVLSTTKAIYQKFIDEIDEQLEELGETPPSS